MYPPTDKMFRDHAAAIMALKDGAEDIEILLAGDGPDRGWDRYTGPTHDGFAPPAGWLRIKPKFRPFTPEECELLVGLPVLHCTGGVGLVYHCNAGEISVGGFSCLYKPDTLLQYFQFLDGSPCGVLE